MATNETSGGGIRPGRAQRAQTPGFYLELSAYWFAQSFLWAGMITVVIQNQVLHIAGDAMKDLYLGWALGLGALVSTVVCIVVGTLSDRSRWRMGRRRPYIIVGTLLALPALMALPRVNTMPALMGVFCAIQLFVNIATSPYQALMPDLVPRERQGAASAFMGLGSLTGQLGGLVLCTMLITRPNGLWTIMATLSGVLVLAMVYTVARIPEVSAAENLAPRMGVMDTLAQAFRVEPRRHPDFFWLIASRFVVNMGFYTATQFLLYYVRDTLRAPRPEQVLQWLFVVTTVSGLLGNFPAGLLSDRMSKKTVVYVSAAITALGAIVFLLTRSVPVALGASVLFGMGFGAFQAVDWALATNLMPEHDEAKYMGVWHVAFTAPQVVAPLVGGVLAHLGNQYAGQGAGYRLVMVLVVVYFAIGASLLRPVRERVIITREGTAPAC